MKIIISERKVQKPIDKPITVMENKKPSNLPIPIESKLPMIINNVTKNELKNKNKFQFKIAKPKLSFFHIIPHITSKNDKVDLFINSFADSYKELYQCLNQFKYDEEGLHLPIQDKVFFETIIKKDSFDNYIVTTKDLAEYVNQQLSFTWNCTSTEVETNEISLILNNKYKIGCEFKLKYPSCLALRSDARIQENPLREYLELSRTLMDNETVIIQFGFQPTEKDWWKEAEKIMKELPKRIKVSETSKTKLGYQGYDCCLRVIVSGEKEHRLQQILMGYVFAIKQINHDNELQEKIIKTKYFEKWLKKEVLNRRVISPIKSLSFNKRFILTQREICNFIKLPQAKLQQDFGLKTIDKIETEIPKSLQTKTGIPIGHAEIKGKKILITIPTSNLDDYMKSYIYTGSPRVGKDTAIINLIVESAKRGAGAFVPDVIDEQGNNRGMADSIRDALPPDKIIDLNLGDYFNPIYFGLEDIAELIGENGMNVIADNFVKVLGLENTTESQELCSMVAKACKCNLYKMYLFLRSKKYAKQVYQQLLEEDELLAMEIKYEYLDSKDGGKGEKALKTRLKMILGNPHFKNMMAQEPNPNIDFLKWINENKVVIMRMKKMDIGEIGIQVLMYLISMKIFWIKKIRKTDNCTFLVYNEPHQFMSEGLEKLLADMLVESPKYRLSMLIAFHHPAFLSSFLWNAIKSASINWFLFKNTNMRMYTDIADQLDPITPQIAMKTEKYESIFLPFIDGKQETPFFMKMLPPPSMRQKMFDNSKLTLEHSKIYGRPVKEVREMLKQIELSIYQESEEKESISKKKKG